MRREVVLQGHRLPRDKPSVFFAYSASADGAVVGEIKQIVADDFGDKLNLIDWETMADPGQISTQIIEAIQTSQFGICYLSEPGQSSDQFQDNPNVLFEAGMMHVLRHNPGNSLRGWLPIRENTAVTEPVPFDFASDRILTVKRQSDGSLNKEAFRQSLKTQLGAAIGN